MRDGRVLREGVPVDPVSEDGRVRLPDEAIAAIGGVDLEAEVSADEVRLRRGVRPAMPEPALVEGIDVVRRYPGAQGVIAVQGASVAVRPRDFVALMGPSGSGKTTFLGVLAGLDPPDDGEGEWKGRSMSSMSSDERRELRQHGIGVVFQSFGLLPALSAVENVGLPLRVSGMDLTGARARGGMAPATQPRTRMHNRTYELSARQQQRVAVARALIQSPRS